MLALSLNITSTCARTSDDEIRQFSTQPSSSGTEAIVEKLYEIARLDQGFEIGSDPLRWVIKKDNNSSSGVFCECRSIDCVSQDLEFFLVGRYQDGNRRYAAPRSVDVFKIPFRRNDQACPSPNVANPGEKVDERSIYDQTDEYTQRNPLHRH